MSISPAELPTTSTDKPQFVLGPGFNERLEIEKELIDHIRTKGEHWPESSGLYQDFNHSLIDHRSLSLEQNRKLEAATPNFHDQLESFIKQLKENTPPEHPIIVLDVGGGAGSTWAENATHFEDDIKRGRVAFVVTNLVWSPDQFPGGRSVSGANLIHYINTTFRDLDDQSITLPNGQVIPLRENVDLVHESSSLTRWSQVPELDILSACRLLSPFGHYFIAPHSKPCPYDLIPEPIVNQQQRGSAVSKTHRLLQTQYGLKYIREVEEGDFQGTTLLYTVFRKPTAPELEI